MPSNLVDNMKWDDLSMAERTAYIKLGLDNNITDLKVVRGTYNKYAEGGLMDDPPTEDKPIVGPPPVPPKLPTPQMSLSKEDQEYILLRNLKQKRWEATEKKYKNIVDDRTWWHDNWLSQRLNVLLDNITTSKKQYKQDYEATELDAINEFNTQISNLKNTNEVYRPLNYVGNVKWHSGGNAIRTLDYYLDLENKDLKINKAIKFVLKEQKKPKEDIDYFGLTNNYNKVIYYPFTPTPETITHERTHALEAHPLETVILQYFNNNDVYKDGVSKNDYYDNNREVYGRLMELRQEFDLDPTKQYNSFGDFLKDATKKDLENISDEELLKVNRFLENNKLDRYKSKTLLWLLNNVALNYNDNTFISNYAAEGGLLNKDRLI